MKATTETFSTFSCFLGKLFKKHFYSLYKMKTSTDKASVEQEQPKAPKKEQQSERVENIVALSVFALLILLGVGVFTKGFGLLDNSLESGQRVRITYDNDPYLGNASARLLIYEFSDYQCPNCKLAEQRIRAVLEKFPGKYAYIFKNFPLASIHPDSYNAALAAECANEQDKFWEYHDYLFEHNTMLSITYLKEYAKELGLDTQRFNDCLDSQRYKPKVDSDIKTGSELGVPGTPTLFFNGLPVIGAKSEEEYTKIINDELKR
jgi:protein-disulfide isomerase